MPSDSLRAFIDTAPHGRYPKLGEGTNMVDPRETASPTPGGSVVRVGRRRRVAQQGRIVLGPERLLACIVQDLSGRGARIRVAAGHALPDRFALVIAAHDLRTVTARLCWRRDDFAGVAFEGGPVG